MQPLSLLTTMMAVARPLRWIAFFSLFLNLSYLAAPIYMMQVYDRVMHSQSVPTLLYLTLVIALAYLVFAILDGVRGQILAGVSDIVEDTLAARLLQSATSPAERGKNRPLPAHIGRDLDIVRQFAAGSAVLAFIDLPFSAVYLSVLFLLNWALGAFAAASAVLLLGLSVAAERSARSPMATAGRVAGQAYQFGDSLARHADCASTMGLAATLAARWRALRGAMLEAQNLASARAVLLGSATKFVRMFTQSAILGLGAYLAIHHDISGGAVFAGSLLLGRFLAPIESMTAAWRSTLAAADAFTRIRSTSSATTRTYLKLPAPMGAIGLERISWTPPGADRAALIEICLNIEPGAVLAIVGPNAAGKSTLGRVFAGAIRGDEGIARLDGAEFTVWDPAQLGHAIGYLPQEVSLFPGTIRDNIARFGDASDDDVVAAATRAMAHEMINRLPNGYQTVISDSIGGLSGGQRQRVALARAMLGDPPVLVLDEPNASLDAEGEAGLFKAIIAARQRHRTVVMITHSTALVRLADYVATMVGGRVLRVQKATEFFARPTPVPVAAVG